MVGGVGSRALASCGAVAAALAIVAVAASPAAAKGLDRYSIVHGCYSLASASGGPAAAKGGYGLKRGRVRFVGVASRGAAAGPGTLRRYVRRAGVR